jgi:hypothetical protein
MLVLAPDGLRVPRRRLPPLALLGAVFFAAFPVTFNTGLRFTEASRGALMLARRQPQPHGRGPARGVAAGRARSGLFVLGFAAGVGGVPLVNWPGRAPAGG